MLLYLGGIVILSAVGSSISCPPSCPPGTRCSSETDRGCVRCRPGTYQNGDSNSTQCIDCRATCGQKEVIVKNCTSLADTVCQCIGGYYPNKEHTCVPHSGCPPGQGVHAIGTSTQNTVCEACGNDSFSAKTSSTEPCIPCTRCSESEEIHAECTTESDRRCKVIDCGPVANPENGLVNTSAGTTYSKRASFICKDDYYLSGAPTITCESSGNWSNGPPECVALPLDNSYRPCPCVPPWVIASLSLTVLFVVCVMLYLKRRNRRNKSYSLSNNNGGEEEVPSNPSRDVSADVVQEENGGNAVIQSPADAVGNDKSRIDVVKKSNVIPVPPRRNSV